MATVGSLVVNVTASTAGLAKGLGDARGQVRQFAGSIADLDGGVGNLKSSIAGIAGLVAGLA